MCADTVNLESVTRKMERFNFTTFGPRLWLPPVVMGLFLIIVAQYNFLAFHTLAELFSIMIAAVLFAFSWATPDIRKNNFLLFLAVGISGSVRSI